MSLSGLVLEFLKDGGALFVPLVPVVAAAVVVALKRRRAGDVRRGSVSWGSLFWGFLGIGALCGIAGFFAGSELACRHAQYAECTLGGLIVGGPLGFALGSGGWLIYWARRHSTNA